MSDHSVLITLKLSEGQFGSADEMDAIHEMTDKMFDAIEQNDAGEFDGDEFGGGECVLFMYGPDADILFATVEPIVRASRWAKGASVLKRYGDVDDEDAREERIML